MIVQEIDRFLGRVARLRDEITRNKEWMRDYESVRDGYPEWVTRDGERIKVKDITDEHLDRLVPFLERRDPQTSWIKVFKDEKTYRDVRKKTEVMRDELSEMYDVMYECL